MNLVVLMGRLTADPDIKNTDTTTIASYTLAVDRISKEKATDFIRCKAFGKGADFAEKYLKKGMKIAIEGRIQTGSYTNKEGVKVYTTDVIVNSHNFCESKGEAAASAPTAEDDFMNVPGDIDAECPFG